MELKKGFNYEISRGAGKFELMLSIFDDKEITFTIKEPGEFVIVNSTGKPQLKLLGTKIIGVISSVEKEDGSGNSWLIKGHFRLEGSVCNKPFPYFKIKGWYHTNPKNGRKGWIEVIE